MSDNNEITIQGMALNAKAGAVVSAEGISYYVDELSSWPDEVFNKTVRVTGDLVVLDHSKESMKDEQGRWLQKIRGLQRIIKRPQWTVVS